MTLIHCPTCNTYLVEPDKHDRIDCLKCGDNFAIADAHIAYANYTQLVERVAEHHPEQLKRIMQDLGIDVLRAKNVGIDVGKKERQQKKMDAIDAILARADELEEIEAGSVSGREEYLEIFRELGGCKADDT